MTGHEKDFGAFALMYLSERQAREQRDRARQETERSLKEEEERRHLGYLEPLRLYGDRANPRDESMAVSHGVEEKRAKTFMGTNDK